MRERTVELHPSLSGERLQTGRGAFAALVARPSGDPAGLFLLVPGFTGSKEDFADLMPLLADAGWVAAAYDQRGQYETQAGPGADLSLAGLAADAHAVCRALDVPGPARLLGHSLGGLVAQAAVLADPRAWASLTLLCTGPGGFTEVDGTGKRRDLSRLRDLLVEQPLEVVHEIRERHARRAGDPQPPPEVAAFLRERFLASSAVGLAAFAGHLLEAPDRVDEVAATGVPAAVVRGADDDAWSRSRQDDLAARLGTRVVVVQDAAHSPAIENPAALAAVMLG